MALWFADMALQCELIVLTKGCHVRCCQRVFAIIFVNPLFKVQAICLRSTGYFLRRVMTSGQKRQGTAMWSSTCHCEYCPCSHEPGLSPHGVKGVVSKWCKPASQKVPALKSDTSRTGTHAAHHDPLNLPSSSACSIAVLWGQGSGPSLNPISRGVMALPSSLEAVHKHRVGFHLPCANMSGGHV